MLKAEHTALALIDVQGKLASLMVEKESLFRNLRILIQGAQVLELPIFWMEQYPEGLGPTVPEVAELLAGVEPISKLCFSACGKTEFLDGLRQRQVRQVLVAGIETHICVYQTARNLLDLGFHVEVVADAVSSRTQQNRNIGLEKMACAGAEITSVEMALFELLREAGTPQFKQIARLVK
ncbi:MAG: hydrolase [bacterium]|nr:hydrolase [bacterium]